MQLRDKTTGISEQDLLAVAKDFGIKKPRRILDQARAAIADWEIFAREAEVPAETVMAIRAELDA